LSLTSGLLADPAFSKRYETSFLKAMWEFKKDEMGCQLKQEIPLFGTAIINRELSQPLQIELHPKQKHILRRFCTVSSAAPVWKRDETSTDLINLHLQSTEIAILEEPHSIQAYHGFEQGFFTEFTCLDSEGGANETVVAISPVNYINALPDYQNCVSELIIKEQQMTADALFAASKLEVSFTTNSTELTQTADNILNQTAMFFKEHSNYQKIIISGHADKRGDKRQNLRLAEARAKSVKAYFIRQGISAKKIKTKSYGSNRPEDKTNDEMGWRRNRRVVIKLEQ